MKKTGMVSHPGFYVKMTNTNYRQNASIKKPPRVFPGRCSKSHNLSKEPSGGSAESDELGIIALHPYRHRPAEIQT